MVALGGLAAVAAALLALVAAYSIDWLITGIAKSLPDIKLGPFKLSFGGIFSDAVGPILGWCVEHGVGLFDEVGHWVIDHAYIMDEGFKEAAAALAHLSDQIVHVATHDLPVTADKARKDAEGWASKITKDVRTDVSHGANRAIRSLDAAARSAYLDAYHASQTVTNSIAGAAASAADTAIHWAWEHMEALHKTAEHDIAVAHADALHVISDVEHTLTNHIQALTRTVAADYQSAIRTAAADAAGALSDAKHYTGVVEGVLTEHIQALAAATARGIEGAIKTAATDAHEALAAANTALDGAVKAIDGKIGEVINEVGADLTTAEKYARAQAAEALGEANAAMHTAVNKVAATVTTLEGTVATGIAKDAELAATDAAGALKEAVDTVGGALAGVTSDITKEAAAFGGDLTSTEGMVAGAITGAIAAVATRVASLEKCAVTTCDGPNQLGGLLEDLWQAGSLVAFGAFVGEAVEHPRQTGETFAADAHTLYAGAESLMDALTSV